MGKLVGQGNIPWLIVFKEGIFMDLKTLRLMSHERGPQTLWRLKIWLSRQVINDALWKDYL